MMALLNSKERTLDEYSELGYVSSSAVETAATPLKLAHCADHGCLFVFCRDQAGFKLVKTYFDGETTIMELGIA